MKIFQFMVSIPLTIFGLAIVLGTIISLMDGSSELTLLEDLTFSFLLGVLPLLGGLYLCGLAAKKFAIVDRPNSINYSIIFIVISLSVRLIAIMLIFSISSNISNIKTDPDYHVAIVKAVFDTLFNVAIAIWLIRKINKARNWARFVYFALVLIGSIYTLLNFQALFSTPFVFMLPMIITAHLFELGSVLLLFMRSSNAWFRESKSIQHT